MNAVVDAIEGVELAAPVHHRHLTLFPLLGGAGVPAGYLTLDEALAAGVARVTEVSAEGHVPELRFVNEADRPVLLLDGEELVGAKQNRVVNLSILAPAGKTLTIPVSCVEAGRWRADSEDFASSGRAHFAEGRARKAASVSASMACEGRRHSDQGQVWADIAGKAERLRARSATGAMADVYDSHAGSLADYQAALKPAPGQAGALFAINGELRGLDLFDAPETLAKLLPKLVQSYALDALDTPVRKENIAPPVEGARTFLAQLRKARPSAFPAVGLGEDVRLEGQGLCGGALVHQGRAVHLCAFRLDPTAAAGGYGTGSMRPASLRQRSRR